MQNLNACCRVKALLDHINSCVPVNKLNHVVLSGALGKGIVADRKSVV